MEDKINSEQSKYFWFSAPYLVSVGLLYLWGYWWSFGINIFEFASLSDIAMVAIIPVGSAFAFLLMGFFIAEFGYAKHIPEGGTNISNSRVLSWVVPFLKILYWGSVLLLALSSYPGKWFVLPLWASYGPYLLLKSSSFLRIIEDDSKRSLLVYVLVILPIYSFSQGKINANNVLNNTKYLYTEVDGKVLKFLGHVDKNDFFLTKDNSEIFIRNNNEESLWLKKYNKANKEITIEEVRSNEK